MREEWRPVVGYEGAYEVSNLGRVRSLDRVIWKAGSVKRNGVVISPHFAPLKGRILRPGPQLKSGHLSVALGRGNSRMVHQLVLEAFVGPRPPGMIDTLHLNHNPADNRLKNLRYGTRGENVKMDYENGVRKVHPNFVHSRGRIEIARARRAGLLP